MPRAGGVVALTKSEPARSRRVHEPRDVESPTFWKRLGHFNAVSPTADPWAVVTHETRL